MQIKSFYLGNHLHFWGRNCSIQASMLQEHMYETRTNYRSLIFSEHDLTRVTQFANEAFKLWTVCFKQLAVWIANCSHKILYAKSYKSISGAHLRNPKSFRSTTPATYYHESISNANRSWTHFKIDHLQNMEFYFGFFILTMCSACYQFDGVGLALIKLKFGRPNSNQCWPSVNIRKGICTELFGF